MSHYVIRGQIISDDTEKLNLAELTLANHGIIAEHENGCLFFKFDADSLRYNRSEVISILEELKKIGGIVAQIEALCYATIFNYVLEKGGEIIEVEK